METLATTPVKYLDLISQNKEAKEKKQLEFKAKEAHQSVQMHVLETEKAIFSKEAELEEAKSAVPYDINVEMKLASEIDSLNKGLEFANKILAERF